MMTTDFPTKSRRPHAAPRAVYRPRSSSCASFVELGEGLAAQLAAREDPQPRQQKAVPGRQEQEEGGERDLPVAQQAERRDVEEEEQPERQARSQEGAGVAL